MRVYRIAKAIHSNTGAEMMSGEGGLRGSARDENDLGDSGQHHHAGQGENQYWRIELR